jgi:AraC-like DNA-binding protein
MHQFINHLNSFLFGRYSHQKNNKYGPIPGPYFVLVYVEQGSCTVQYDGIEKVIEAGYCGVFASSESFTFWHKKHNKNTIISCEGYFGQMGLKSFKAISGVGQIIPISKELISLLNIGISLNLNKNSNVRLIANSEKAQLNMGIALDKGSDFLSKEYRNAIGYACMRSHSYELRKDDKDALYPNFLIVAKDFIEGNFNDDSLKVSNLAQIATVSEQHLINSFNRYIGMTPSRYIWSKRAKYARKLLMETNLSQQEIAYNSGYKSTPHFCRQIKSHFNKTPNEIRNI